MESHAALVLDMRLFATPFGQGLHALALEVEIKVARKSMNGFSLFGHPTRVNAS